MKLPTVLSSFPEGPPTGNSGSGRSWARRRLAQLIMPDTDRVVPLPPAESEGLSFKLGLGSRGA